MVLIVAVPLKAEGRPFDSAEWRAHAGVSETRNPRAAMIPALEAGLLRRGMTRTDVESLLGPPDMEEPRRMIYRLGRSAFGIDEDFYVIELDARWMVLSFRFARG